MKNKAGYVAKNNGKVKQGVKGKTITGMKGKQVTKKMY